MKNFYLIIILITYSFSSFSQSELMNNYLDFPETNIAADVAVNPNNNEIKPNI